MAKTKFDDIKNNLEDLDEAEQQAVKGGMTREQVLAQRQAPATMKVSTSATVGTAQLEAARLREPAIARSFEPDVAIPTRPTADRLKK